MEERIEIKTIFKSSNPEKIIVFHAASLKDEIRFYFNDEQYVSARDNYDGTFSIHYEEDEKVETDEKKAKSTLSVIKENWKEFLKIVLLTGIVVLLISIMLVILAAVIKNTLIYVLLIDSIIFSIEVISVVILEYKTTPPSLKSKHSAEHMMANFLEKNKRLPQNMSEIKNTTRFTNDCGSRKKTLEYTENFVQNIVTAVIAIIIGSCITQNCKNEILLCIVLIAIYIATGFIVGILMRKYNKLDFIIKPIQKVLNNIVQCSNTTKKVEDNDIIMAYWAAREWLKIVYPEFYNEDEDIFYECEES